MKAVYLELGFRELFLDIGMRRAHLYPPKLHVVVGSRYRSG
jgi:hypothetical protein